MSLNGNVARKDHLLFISTTIIIVIGILSIFIVNFFGINDHIKTINHQKKGVLVIEQAYNIVLNIQRLRGLNAIENRDDAAQAEIFKVRKELKNDCKSLESVLKANHEVIRLKSDMLSFLSFINDCSFENFSYDEFTQTIWNFIEFNKQIAYHSQLVLEEDIDTFILVNNIAFIFPELIENNGKIRATILRGENNLTHSQVEELVILQSKIRDKLAKLKFSNALLEDIMSVKLDNTKEYKQMFEAQERILNFASKSIENRAVDDKVFLAYETITQNINIINNLYKLNITMLNDNLKKHLKLNQLKQVYTIFGTLFIVVFVLYINRYMYIKTKKYIDTIEELTITDALTTLLNRRSFDEALVTKVNIAQRTDTPLAFFMIDIDYFKQYNDTYGHHKGDEALKAVALVLKNSALRASDMVFRLGGEEFGILALGMNQNEAIIFANKIRTKVEELKLEHKANKASSFVTISIGVLVVKPKKQCCIDCLYKKADKALYEAKDNGRNQVVLFRDNKNIDI